MSVKFAVAAAAVSAVGSIQAGKDQKRAYNYNAQVNERKAKVAEQDAEQLVLMEEVEIGRFRREFDNLQAATSQSFRFNGWMADTGTPLKVALANASEADEEVAIRRYNAKVGKAELKEKGTQERMSANLNRMYGRAAMRAAYFKAGSSLLSGGSSYSQINSKYGGP